MMNLTMLRNMRLKKRNCKMVMRNSKKVTGSYLYKKEMFEIKPIYMYFWSSMHME